MLLLCLGLIGCAAPTSLRFWAMDGGQEFEQSFSRGYAGRGERGDFDVVMTEDGVDQAPDPKPDGTLVPTPEPPLRHLLHVRVLWLPLRGTRLDNPSATNASIDWYVMGTGSRQHQDMLAYSGVGYVELEERGQTARLVVRNATLKPRGRCGMLADPVGACRVSGSILAIQDRSAVDKLLAEMRDATGALEARAQGR